MKSDVIDIKMNLLILIGLVMFFISINQINYLFFHSFAELFSIIIAFTIFTIGWNSRHIIDGNYMMLLCIAYLGVGFIDTLHLLAYKGMGVFVPSGSNLATQLWIAARGMESISLLIGFLLINKKLNLKFILIVYGVFVIGIVSSILFWEVFPECYNEQTGLTLFKKYSEYIICSIILASAFVIHKFKNRIHPHVYQSLILSITFTILAELSFTLYMDVYGILNWLGHIFKVISFYFVYLAFVQKSLRNPYGTLFRQLKESEQSFKKQSVELKRALSQIKILKGLLPICSYCKNIRDDQGYWYKIESYFMERSEVDFSHGICPECYLVLSSKQKK